jgi:hypothetical protein
MSIFLPHRSVGSSSVLAAGLALCRIHGPFYARSFLEEQGVDKDVITELLDSDDGPTTAPQPKLPTEP